MYTPRHFAMTDEHVRSLLATAETAQLVTAHETGPVATLLPLTWRPDAAGEGLGSLVFHVTRVNPVWKEPHLGEALAILSGPDGYIDADWYASNAEAPGVPTWNYVTVHAYGPLVVHDDAEWLRAIVGIELPIARVEAKAKLNQNRTPADIAGAIAGLRSVGNAPLADVMDEVSVPHAEQRHALLADIRGRNLGHLRPPVG